MKVVEGNVDNLGPEPLHGWARDPSRPELRVSVRVVLDGVTVGVVSADRFREDLEAAGIGDGRHGFELSLGAHLDASSAQRLEVLVADTGQPLWSGSTAPLKERAEALNGLRSQSVWAVNHVSLNEGRLELRGYVVPAADGPALDPVVLIDGTPPESFEFPVESPPSCARLWFVPGAQRLGFSCRSAAPAADGRLRFDCVDRSTGKPLRPHDSFHLPPSFSHQLRVMPAAEQLARVQGNTLEDVYLLWGHTAVTKLDALLEERLGRGLASFDTILDWGCGCGRLTRHLVKLKGPRVSGADIDANNLIWCASNLPDASWVHLPMTPPAPWPDSTFELVMGLSIFTHLREADQDAWLEELRRISKPGALLALTVNGATAMWWADPYPELFEEWRRRGFSDQARDPALDGVIDDAEYYRATFHSLGYIRERWGRFFEVVDIVEAFAHIQDMVILRNPK